MSAFPLEHYISQIRPPDTAAMNKASVRLDSLVKPPGSLGKLESIAITLAGIGGDTYYSAGKRCVIIMAADNGVAGEGVASAPQSVTYMQTINFTKGITGVAVLAKQFGADLKIVDVGVNAQIDHPLVINRKVRMSTENIAKRDAMTRDQAVEAVLAGIETAIDAAKQGYTLLGAGEMGIGNTTTSAAVLSALTGLAAEQTAGRGAGLTESGYRHKIQVIETALRDRAPDPTDPIDVLAKVGGLDIAAMAGVYIGGGYMRIPVVIDGFISIVAALVAACVCPAVRPYMIASHASDEQGYKHAAKALEIEPCLHLDMRLGEGSGCPLMFAMIDAACALIRDMGTFEQAGIGEEYLNALQEA
ncbi:MAG: nicotinate-nucleotide--dimethylbenzimidazole phosphoribosyltransferase [Oscillospiraceae bacterium]|nr:nicotinate-nucleotide--dimethylbenzimidazole phosphoribosyltransferase [Oscillospiraceae bacterium]